MIGMSQIRKRLIYGILIGVGIGVIGIGITLAWSISTVNSYKNGTNKDYVQNYTKEIVMLNRDVTQGETITGDMLTSKRVHENSAPNNIVGRGVVGQIAKYNIPANIPLVDSMFGDNIISTDERIQEVNTVNLPSDLYAGDYIDIKIKMASGVEYVVIPQIQVVDVRGTTILLHLNEEDLYYLNSAIVDTYLSNGGAVLYGVKYVDEDTQIKLSDEETINNAKYELAQKIEKDVADGTVVLNVPAEVENTTTENVEGAESTETTEVTETQDSQEYVNFTNNLSDLILKYAIEYRYYVESYNKVERTYQPSTIVMDHMKTNKYITEKAKAKLSADVRSQIEATISEFQNVSGENYELAVSGLTNQITAQQALRNSTLSGNQ